MAEGGSGGATPSSATISIPGPVTVNYNILTGTSTTTARTNILLPTRPIASLQPPLTIGVYSGSITGYLNGISLTQGDVFAQAKSNTAAGLYFFDGSECIELTAVGSLIDHSILSTTHGDTLADAALVRGDIIVANSTPKWGRYSIGASGSFLKSNGTDVLWSTAGLKYSDLVSSAINIGTNLITAGAVSSSTGFQTSGRLLMQDSANAPQIKMGTSTPQTAIWSHLHISNSYQRFGIGHGIEWNGPAWRYDVTDPTYNRATFTDENGTFAWGLQSGVTSSFMSHSEWTTVGHKMYLSTTALYPRTSTTLTLGTSTAYWSTGYITTLSSSFFYGNGANITGIVTSSYATTSSYARTSSAATSITFTPVTASYALTSSVVTTPSQPNITTAANLVTVGALDGGSITSNFGSINIGTDTVSCGTLSATTGSFSYGVTSTKSGSWAYSIGNTSEGLSGWGALNINRGILGANVTGDSQWRILVNAGGAINWGDGTLSIDTNLYRSARNVLKTDDNFTIGSLGTFNGTGSAPATDQVLAFDGATNSWIPRTLQSNFASGVVSAGTLADSSTAILANTSPILTGSAITSSGAPILTPGYYSIIVDMSATGSNPTLPVGCEYVLDYSKAGGAYTSGAIHSTSAKVVHSNLTPATLYAYKYKIRGSTVSPYSTIASASASIVSEVNAFGLVAASQIATANLAAINANIGTVTAGKIQNNLNSAGIRLDSTAGASNWYRVIDLSASGSQNFIQFGPDSSSAINFAITADGTASFAGDMSADQFIAYENSNFYKDIRANHSGVSSFRNLKILSASVNPYNMIKGFDITENSLIVQGTLNNNSGSMVTIGDFNAYAGNPVAIIGTSWSTNNATVVITTSDSLNTWYYGDKEPTFSTSSVSFPSIDGNYVVYGSYYIHGDTIDTWNSSTELCDNLTAYCEILVDYKINGGASWIPYETIVMEPYGVPTSNGGTTSDSEVFAFNTHVSIPGVTSQLIIRLTISMKLILSGGRYARWNGSGTVIAYGGSSVNWGISTLWDYNSATPQVRRGLKLHASGSQPHVWMEPLAALPSTTTVVEGEMCYVGGTTHKAYIYGGSPLAWQALW